MNNTNLEHTKKKLTIIFTLLVFGIAVLLEGVFFTVKYFNSSVADNKTFISITGIIEDRFITLNDFVKNYNNSKGKFRMGQGMKLNQQKEDFINIIIIDNQKKEVAFTKIINDINIDIIKEGLLETKYGKINKYDGYLIKKNKLIDNDREYDVLFIKDLRYSFSDYLKDLLGFIFINFIFSALFYYIGYRFVSKNLEPVETNLKDMQDFIHNAGHELKTPISIIHSNLQLIKATKTYEKDLVVEGLTEINRLDHLIESLIELSNINSSEYIEETNINDEIKTIIKDFKVESEKKEIKIKFRKIDNKNLRINKQYFYILFSNLLGNAIKYNNVGGKIDVTLDKNKIIIKDNGVGISKENLEKVFDRFYMVEQSRNNEGHGIGLSLVKKISDMYGWKINVKSKKGDGSEFIIEF